MSSFPVYRAVLLDRDGVINDNPDWYVLDWAEFIWLPGALEALCTLKQLDIPVAIVTNQGCIARGLTTAEKVAAVHARMMQAVAEAGGEVSAVYSCPHYHEGCSCEKPQPGNVLHALSDLGVDAVDACFVGDRLVDMQAAHAVGVDGYMLRCGYWHDWPRAMQSETPPVAIFEDLAAFVAEVVVAQAIIA